MGDLRLWGGEPVVARIDPVTGEVSGYSLPEGAGQAGEDPDVLWTVVSDGASVWSANWHADSVSRLVL